MNPTLSVIVPTEGRPTLRRTLRSVVPQLEAGDEVIVVADGANAMRTASKILSSLRDRCSLHVTELTRSWGNAQRDFGMAVSSGSHLAFMDDDDVYAPGAIAAIRRAIEADPNRVHIFRMRAWNGHVLPVRHEVASGNVSTQMIVVPNVKRTLGTWVHPELADQGRSDFAFISQTIGLTGAPVWQEDLVALCRPSTKMLIDVKSSAIDRRDVLATRLPAIAALYRRARAPLRRILRRRP